MSGVLYNEIDPYAAAWLSNLAAEGHVAPGHVDTRSIVDLRPSDLDGITQFHAFAGIGGWSLALRLAGVPDDFPVWTGSCPCQPFSAAGQRKGFDDARHLWPVWFGLIRECRPAIVLGEQVEAAVRHGWLDTVFSDLEGEDYACGSAVLGAHSVGAPHIRLRTWFVAQSHGQRPKWADEASTVSDRYEPQRRISERGGALRVVADASRERCDRQPTRLRQSGSTGRYTADRLEASGCGAASFWSGANWISCRDGKTRSVEPGTFPLAHGAPSRVGRLRAYGNAIVPQVAAEFIAAALGLPDRRASA